MVHRDPSGSVDGYARYHAEEKWEQRQPRTIVRVDDLHALTDDAYAELWRFLAETDWAASIKAERRSPSERLPWLLSNARAAEMSGLGDGLWVRLFDVDLAERRYRESDSDYVKTEIESGVQYALAAPFPSPGQVDEDVYA